MAHQVTCQCCGQRFDRDTTAFVEVKTRRYAHAACYLRERVSHPELPKLQVIDPNDQVTCIYCKQTFDKSKTACVQVSKGKYAHSTCYESEKKREKTDEEKLNDYVMKLFHMDYVPPRVQKQIKNYVNDYNFTYTGILKALKYFYEIQGHSLEKANDGIGIVPYIYKAAYNYYYSIWLANQKNADKDINDYVKPEVREVRIPIPQRKIQKRKLFSFLDEEEESE